MKQWMKLYLRKVNTPSIYKTNPVFVAGFVVSKHLPVNRIYVTL